MPLNVSQRSFRASNPDRSIRVKARFVLVRLRQNSLPISQYRFGFPAFEFVFELTGAEETT
jgi:hypothetical protein